MANEQIPATGEPTTTTSTTTTTPPAPTLDELQAELAKARDALTAANHEAAERRKKLSAYEAAEVKRQEDEKKRRDAELSEVEKLKQAIAEKDNALASLAEKHSQALRRQAIERLAAQAKWGKQKRPFIRPEQAFQLADWSDVVETDGKLLGIEEALTKLADENEHLLDAPTRTNLPPTNSTTVNQSTDAEAKRKELLQRFPRLKV